MQGEGVPIPLLFPQTHVTPQISQFPPLLLRDLVHPLRQKRQLIRPVAMDTVSHDGVEVASLAERALLPCRNPRGQAVRVIHMPAAGSDIAMVVQTNRTVLSGV